MTLVSVDPVKSISTVTVPKGEKAMASTKTSSILEKIITTGTLAMIVLGVLFGIVAIRGLNSALNAEDQVQAHLTAEEKMRDQVFTLQLHQQAQTAGVVSFLLTGQPRPYLDQANEARNEFLNSLREIRERSADPSVRDFLDRIGQTEMDYQLALAKAIESRRKGPNFMAVSIALQSFVQPKRVALDKILEKFAGFENARFSKELQRLQAQADSTSRASKRNLFSMGFIVLASASGILLFNMLLLAKRHAKEKRAIESEARLRTALQAAEVVTWERDLTNDVFDKSPRHLKLYGFTKDPPLWNFETFLRTVIPADRDMVKARILQAIETKTQYCLDFHVKWPDKSVHRIFSKGQILCEADKAVRICGFDTDATSLDAATQNASEDDGWGDAPTPTVSREAQT